MLQDRTRLAIVIVATMLTIGCFATSICAQGQTFDDGVKLYTHKQYKQALPILLNVLKQDPRNASAYLYIANCYYCLQQVAYAKQTYQIIVRNFAGSSEANTATDFLKRLEAVATPSATTAAAGGDSQIGKPSSAPAKVADQSISDIVRVIRPVQDHPPVSDLLISAVKSKLDTYPPFVKKLLRENRINVILTTTLIDRNPELKNREGRGYDGYTYKSCPGMFENGRDIVICERTMDEGTESVHEPILTSDILHTLNHECGHAIDHCLDNFCESEEFKHAYLLDAAKVQQNDPQMSKDLAYYLQKSTAGQQECCGELIGILLGTESERAEKMKSTFGQTIKVLKKKLQLTG